MGKDVKVHACCIPNSFQGHPHDQNLSSSQQEIKYKALGTNDEVVQRHIQPRSFREHLLQHWVVFGPVKTVSCLGVNQGLYESNSPGSSRNSSFRLHLFHLLIQLLHRSQLCFNGIDQPWVITKGFHRKVCPLFSQDPFSHGNAPSLRVQRIQTLCWKGVSCQDRTFMLTTVTIIYSRGARLPWLCAAPSGVPAQLWA